MRGNAIPYNRSGEMLLWHNYRRNRLIIYGIKSVSLLFMEKTLQNRVGAVLPTST